MGGKEMNIFKTNKMNATINRLNKMIDNAIEGNPIESGFDETKVSALETKLSHYLAMNSTTKIQLSQEKQKINEMISDISHQTKTPIANILLYSQLLEESYLNNQDKDCVESLVEQAQKLDFLISALVKTSRLETGIITVNPKKEYLQILFDTISKQAIQSANEKNIKLIFCETQVSGTFDMKWTTEAIYNIVDNGVKYTPQGGSVTVKATAYEMFVRIDVIDTGIGIREEETAKVFARFYRSPLVSDKEGLGIGLYLAREIISREGGYIKVSSKIGVGSTFSIFLLKE